MAPEMQFYRIEQCQEIQTIAQDPYMPKQIIGNAASLLMQSGIFPLKEFEWEATAVKTYPILKTFIHEAYSRRLMAMQLRNTADSRDTSTRISTTFWTSMARKTPMITQTSQCPRWQQQW
jgi:hypothetical protein